MFGTFLGKCYTNIFLKLKLPEKLIVIFNQRYENMGCLEQVNTMINLQVNQW